MSKEYEEHVEEREPRRREGNGGNGGNGCMTWFGYLLLMITGGMILLALIAMVGVWRTGDRFVEELDTIFSVPNVPTPTPKIDIRSVLVTQIRDASELTTTIFTMETITEASQSQELLGVEVGETRLLYIGYGEVRAGIDLSEIEVEDIRVISDTIRIRIPRPRILDSKIDVKRSRVYDYDRGFLGPDAPELQSLAEQEALDKIIAAACENGVLEAANERGELVMARLMSVAGFKDIEVQTQSPAPDECRVQ
ncbi:MAG: DUF4230 domain-containing protein [Ardenticatenaceae bacterium]